MQFAPCRPVLFLVLSVSVSALGSDQKAVRFDSAPPGAQVELQGRILCTTPCSATFPPYYFSKHFTYWSKRLSEPLKVRFTKAGYVPKDVTITVGPLRWQAWNTRDYFDYYRINDEQFTVQLGAATEFLSPTSIPTTGASNPNSIEEVVRRVMPAIVQVETVSGHGSGFSIGSGVIVTNAHVIGNNSTAVIHSGSNEAFQSVSIYTDDARDLALVKIAGVLPQIPLAADLPSAGADVIAIGSPGVGAQTFANSVTKGVMSGVRSLESGIYIQTDASINPGNSGGPLLDRDGNVIGVNSLKVAATGYSGLNFAISKNELLQMIAARFGADTARGLSATRRQQPGPMMSVDVDSTPTNADIEVDGAFVGSTPSQLPFTVGQHTIKVSKKGYVPYERNIDIRDGAKLTLHADLDLKPPS